ncbi:MAG: polysaccharide biosynthesis tyrosine autokinase, partial [Pseudomonadota bacterium]
DLRALINSIWRQKLTIAAFGFGFAFLAVVGVYMVTPRYTASSVVMLDVAEQQIIDLESVASSLSTDYFTIIAQAEVLKSRKLAGRVVDSLELTTHPEFNPDLIEPEEPPLPVAVILQGVDLIKSTVRGAVSEAEAPSSDRLDPTYWDREAAIDRLLDRLNVQSVRDTYVYSITIETEDAFLSADIANKYAEMYILDQLETKFEQTEQATEWLSQRVAELRIDLEASEAAVESYNSATTLISEEVLAGMSVQLKEMRERRESLSASAVSGAASLAQLRERVAERDYAGAAELLALPRLAGIASEIEELSEAGGDARRLAEQSARFDILAERAVAQKEAELARNISQSAAIEDSIVQLEVQLESQSQDLVELRQLQREAEANRRIYEQFLRRLNETTVQEGVQQADARLLSPAVIEFSPSFPNKTLTVLLAGFFGGVVGIAVVVALEQMNHSYRTSEELEKATGLSVLGSIPAAPVRTRRSLLSYANERSSSALMEAIRNLRTGVLLANVDKPPQVVMLTSSLPKEGKTTCSLLLSQNAAALGKKVLLIECDLRRRTFRTYFDAKDRTGLMTILTGAKTFDEVVHHDEASGMDVVLGEESKANAADVFSSRRFAEFIEECRSRYDFVVIDTPPVLAVPDARVIAPLADAVLYCVRWNTTHRDLVRNGLAAFAQIKVRVTGLALTQINTRKMASYGYGGYSYYYYKTSSRYYLN